MEPSVETNGQKAARERLDVPSQASIERKLLVRNDAPTVKPPISQPQRNGDLLTRLQTFLPQMEEANKNLEVYETAAEARFEDPEEDEGPVVELDLACGVFDLKDETAIAAAERSLINQDVAVDRFSGGCSSDSNTSSSDDSDVDDDNDSKEDSDSEDESEKIVDKKLNKKGNGKKPPRHHPGIQEIS
ncbi:hypothetical protein Ndes2526B_g09151 [Nannochloris sp. 'desiccata']